MLCGYRYLINITSLLMTNKKVVFMLGGPGCGKGTQTISLSEKYGFGHAAAGDLLREEAKKDTPTGRRIAELINAGAIVPPELLVDLIKSIVSSAKEDYFLLDGFPRSVEQDDAWRASGLTASAVVMMEIPDDVIIGRISKRGESSGRADDDASVVLKRIENYRAVTLPVITRYEGEGLVKRIDGNQTIEKVSESIVAVLRQYWTF